MYYDLDDNIDNINIPDEFVEITSLLKLHKKNIRKKMLKMIHNYFDEDCEESKKQLMDIMEYAVFSGGKHYRSFFIELLGRIFNLKLSQSIFIGALVEMTHNYIVMQNAMPEIENDDFRHNRESCHKRFGNAQTIIASNALYSLIMEIITTDDKTTHIDNDIRCKIVKIIAKYSGKDGASGGQMMKLMLKKQKKSQDEKVRINKLKLNSLFYAGAECIEEIIKTNTTQNKSIKDYINNFCNLMSIYEEVYQDKNNDNILIEKAKLFCEQGLKSANKLQNENLLVDFIKYNFYCINKLVEEKNKNKPIIVNSEKKEDATL